MPQFFDTELREYFNQYKNCICVMDKSSGACFFFEWSNYRSMSTDTNVITALLYSLIQLTVMSNCYVRRQPNRRKGPRVAPRDVHKTDNVFYYCYFQLLLYMFCTYMDSRLPADPSFPDGRTFTGLHFLKTPDKPSKSHI